MKELLKTLCCAAGVNGATTEISQVIADLLRPYTDKVYTDPLTVWGMLSGGDPQAPLLVLEAHMDEIGFVVTGFDKNGFLRVSPSGGADSRTLAAAPVTVLCDPPLPGVFCSTPPHLSEKNDKLLTALQRGIDVGMTKEEAEQRIPIGTRVMFEPRFDCLLGNRVCSKALDDRCGVAAVLRAMQLLHGKKLPFRVAAAFCTQEEVGMRSAGPMAFRLQPDVCIAVDVGFADHPAVTPARYGKLGKGPKVAYSPVLNREVYSQLRGLAKKHSIPVQYSAVGSTTSTDSDVISKTGAGVPTGLLSVPLRYMHSPIEVIDTADVEAAAQLMAAFAEEGSVPTYD